MTQYRILPTTRQLDYLRALQQKLHLTDAVLDQHCRNTFGAPLEDLERSQVTDLITELKGWEAVPAELKRAMGQLDLFEVPS